MHKSPDITQTLSEFVAGLSLDTVPVPVKARARMLLLDCIGNIVRARHDAESTAPLLAAVRAIGLDRGAASVFADGAGYAPAGSVLLNATLAHSLDFDDTHAAAIFHAAAPIVPAALAAAEIADGSGADALAGVIAGYEAGVRIALALPPGAHYDRGFHPSATCGVFGAAAAAARVLGLDARQTANAFGIALSQAAGSLQFLANGAWTKRFQVGWASMAGFTAAVLAREQFKGAAEALEGKHGFLRAYAPAPVPERVVQGLGAEWELLRTGVKPYPSCRWGHAGIDAALEFYREYRWRPEEIESVTLGLSQAAMLLIGAPAAKKANPQNIVDAQFSAPFVIACALVTGRMVWDSYGGLNDPAIRELMARITCENDPEIEKEFPENMAGKLTVRAGGKAHVRKIVSPKGEPENFLSEAELLAKYHGLVDGILDAGRAGRLAEAILHIDALDRAKRLFAIANDPVAQATP